MHRTNRYRTNRSGKILSDKWLFFIALFAIIGYFVLANVFIDPITADDTTINKPYISKQTAMEMAQQFISEKFQIEAASASVYYQTAKDLEGYLQKNGWLNEYLRRDGSEFPLQYYQVEVGEEERFRIYVDPTNGNVFAWEQVNTNHPIVDDDDRLHRAEQFLAEQGYRLAQWEISESANPYRFISSHNELTYGEATKYIDIQVAEDGNILTYTAGFILPEEHTAWVHQQDRLAALMSAVYLIVSLLFLIIAICIAVILRRNISFKRGIGLAILFLFTHALHNINMLPTYRLMMGSDVDTALGAIIYLLFMQIYTIATTVLVYFALVAGEGLWRQIGRNVWARLQDETSNHSIVKAMGRGYLFSLIILGLQQTFYLFAQRQFGVWTVDDPSFSVHNLLWPFFYPLLAWAAAISEEAIFRLFGIAFFKKLLRNTFAAALASSMIWAIGHMTYPIYPVYTRFIEVTLLGLLFAFIMLQYGWITAVFAHASVNSILTGIGLIAEFSGAIRWVALLYILSPAIIAYFVFIMQKIKRRSQLSLR